MNSKHYHRTLEASIQLVQEWKLSGLTQVAFAKSKGMTDRQMEYQVRKVRQQSPESLCESALAKVDFVAVPQEYLNSSTMMYESTEITDQPVMMIRTGAANLQVSNQVDPYLLKTALEVILSC